jgi:hypothetical protein
VRDGNAVPDTQAYPQFGGDASQISGHWRRGAWTFPPSGPVQPSARDSKELSPIRQPWVCTAGVKRKARKPTRD